MTSFGKQCVGLRRLDFFPSLLSEAVSARTASLTDVDVMRVRLDGSPTCPAASFSSIDTART
jgi:hypothetical protein